MKIALYFILFIGFMVTVTVIDRLTSGPLIKLDPSEKREGAIMVSEGIINSSTNSRGDLLIKDTEVFKERVTKERKFSKARISNQSNFESKKITSVKEPEKLLPVDYTSEKEAMRETIFKGDEYAIFSFEGGKLKHEKKIWFDYMNPPSKKLRRDDYKSIWAKKGCCLWRNGSNYEVVFDSNLFFKIGAKKIPVKKK